MFRQASSLILLLIPIIVSGQEDQEINCGYKSCPQGHPDKLNVHLVCHSHDDTGWIKTVDQYYTGSYGNEFNGDDFQKRAGVQYILDTVIRELAFDTEKKFIQVETAFFWRWWTEQDNQTKALVTDLVNSGQLEFISGGWCMNDEAAAHYVAIIDQMSFGFKKLRDTFGVCGIPKTAWQIDPFGHSKEQADLFKGLGMDSLLFGRLDYREKDQRFATQTGEMLWKTSSSNKNQSLFTTILYDLYVPPSGFCWDASCTDEPLMSNPKLHDYNIDERAREFVAFARRQKEVYATNNILVTMGMDFNFQIAHMWYKNIDKLIQYVNEELGESEKIHLMYSNPSCYIKALNEEDQEWPIKEDDFFPYASDQHSYWTGYFTSRPTSKRMIRQASQWLQFAKQFTALSFITGQSQAPLLEAATEKLSRAVAVSQHHDAITGTEKQHVAHDYHRRLHAGIESFINSADLSYCPYLNISQCEITENSENQLIVIYNPLARSRDSLIRLPVVDDSEWVVQDGSGQSLEYQLTPIPNEVKNIPGRVSIAEFELAFAAESIPPMGLKTFSIQRFPNKTDSSKIAKQLYPSKEHPGRYEISTKSGLLVVQVDNNEITLQTPETKLILTSGFAYYEGHAGFNINPDDRASGAYIFRPIGDTPVALKNVATVVQSGTLYTELQIQFDNNASLLIRTPAGFQTLYRAEYEWLVGPISVEDGIGKEYIFKVNAENFTNNDIFYTDANGRQIIERKLNYRPSYDIGNVTFEEPVSSNYYPINSAIFIRDYDTNEQVAVINDRAQGGSCLKDGELELMVHRRLLYDDAYGVGEALNEEAFGVGLVARGRHFLIMGENEEVNAKRRQVANELFGEPLVLFPNRDNLKYLEILTRDIQPNAFELPINVNLLTFEPWFNESSPEANKQYLIRLEHLFEEGEHSTLSLPVTISLTELFGTSGLAIGEISFAKETTLGGNQWLEDKEHLIWRAKGDEMISEKPNFTEDSNLDIEEVVLGPLEIRTFIIEFA